MTAQEFQLFGESESLLNQNLLEAISHAGIAVEWVDCQSGRFLNVNEYAASLHDLSVDEMRGMLLWEIDPYYPPEKFQQVVDTLRLEGKLNLETVHRKKSGEEFPIEVSISYRGASEHTPEHFVAFIKDISERKRHEKSLEDKERDLRNLTQRQQITLQALNRAGIAVEWIDINSGKFLNVSQITAKQLGYSLEETTQLYVHDIDPNYSKESFLSLSAHLRAEGLMQIETIHQRKDGTQFPVEIISTYHEAYGQYPEHLVAFVIDISERRQREVELKEALRTLADQTERQQQMFAVIGHELRTPVASLKMLQDALNISQLGPYGATMQDVTQHLLTVLEDLRTVVQPERVQASQSVDSDVFQVIQRAMNSQHKLLEDRGLSVSIQADDAAHELCHYNVQALRQIALNLIKNAAIHSGASQLDIHIITTRQTKEHCRFTLAFADNGKGIAEHEQQKLFEAFYRGSTQEDGTGLGLHICRDLARQLGGNLIYQAADIGGACFVLTLELSLAIPQVETQKLPEPRVSLDGLMVLVAEDNELLAEMTQYQLEEQGAIVLLAANGIEALDLAEQAEVDFVLTDIFMPQMDGYGLVKHLRERGFAKPIIGVTAAVVGEETDQLIAAGANATLAKPIDMSRVAQLYQQFSHS